MERTFDSSLVTKSEHSRMFVSALIISPFYTIVTVPDFSWRFSAAFLLG